MTSMCHWPHVLVSALPTTFGCVTSMLCDTFFCLLNSLHCTVCSLQQTAQRTGWVHLHICLQWFAVGHVSCWASLGSPVWYWDSHLIDVKRRSLFFSSMLSCPGCRSLQKLGVFICGLHVHRNPKSKPYLWWFSVMCVSREAGMAAGIPRSRQAGQKRSQLWLWGGAACSGFPLTQSRAGQGIQTSGEQVAMLKP